MKKTLMILLMMTMLLTLAFFVACAEAEADAVPGEPLTWAYLCTIAGAAAATTLVVQFCKVPLDMIWKIPTRVFVYFIALAFMLLGTAFTVGLTLDTIFLTAVNAVIAAITAYGGYEITFAKKDSGKT